MGERRELSAERLQLIRRFMGEEGEALEAEAAESMPERLAERQVEPSASVAVRRPVAAQASPATLDAPGPLRVAFGRLPRAARRVRIRTMLRWPLVATVIGVIVGVLIARSA